MRSQKSVTVSQHANNRPPLTYSSKIASIAAKSARDARASAHSCRWRTASVSLGLHEVKRSQRRRTTAGEVDTRMGHDETFGPVLSVMSFGDEQELTRQANDPRFRLAAGIWTRDIRRARRVAHTPRTGTVWIDAYRTLSFNTPFRLQDERLRTIERTQVDQGVRPGEIRCESCSPRRAVIRSWWVGASARFGPLAAGLL
jgi:hypothetical protein